MNTKAIIITAALLGLTACSDSENTEPEAVATLYTIQRATVTDSPRVIESKVAHYYFLHRKGIIKAETTDGKIIYSSAFTLIEHK